MFKKNKIKLSILFVLLLTITSCNDDFLERTPQDDTIAVTDVEKTAKLNPEILDATLRGLYASMYTVGTGGLENSHNDFGQKVYDIYSDLLSSDMALSVNTYRRFQGVAQLVNTTDYTETRGTYQAWRYYYRLIRAANLIITASGGNDAVITDANRFTMGQAKAMRAYCYFYLAQFYIPEYTADSKILPIYIDSEDPKNKPQSTTKEVYDLIINDLTEAISLLENFTRTEKYQVNKDVAKSLLAYTYASIGTSEANLKAKALAEEVIESGYPLTTKDQAVGGFNDVSTASWLWGVDITTDMNLHLWSWWGQMDIFSYSYQYFGDTKSIDIDLFNQIKDTDIRKTQFLNSPSHQWHLSPYKKFYHYARKPRGTGLVTDLDYIYLRIDEMYLLSAEMSAKEGMDADAKSRLKELLSLRFDNSADYNYINSLSGTALVNEIYLQTRIELWGEGKSYLAMKRNKATVTRGANNLYHVGLPIKYNDDRLTYPIPQAEILNNPFIN